MGDFMIEAIVFLGPACISLLIHNWIMNKEFDIKKDISIYGGYACIIDFISFIILFLTKDEFFFLDENFVKPAFVFKLFGINLVIGIVLAFVVCIISKNFKIKANFVETKNENNKKRR